MRNILFVFLSVLLLANVTFAECSNDVADSIVEKKLLEIAKQYNSKKVGIGHTILLGTVRSTDVIVMNGDGGTDGPKVDRIGTINVDTEKCRYKSYLIGVYSTYDLEY